MDCASVAADLCCARESRGMVEKYRHLHGAWRDRQALRRGDPECASFLKGGACFWHCHDGGSACRHASYRKQHGSGLAVCKSRRVRMHLLGSFTDEGAGRHGIFERFVDGLYEVVVYEGYSVLPIIGSCFYTFLFYFGAY